MKVSHRHTELELNRKAHLSTSIFSQNCLKTPVHNSVFDFCSAGKIEGHCNLRFNFPSSKQRQQGVVLLLIVLAMLAIGGGILIAAVVAGQSESQRRTSQTLESYDLLVAAKEAIIGYSTGLQSGGTRPGQMPPPDTLANNNYDGTPDSGCFDATQPNGTPELSNNAAKSANLRCIGRVPWATLGLSMANASQQDVLGQVPWYAVSQNLVQADCMKYLNSQTASQSTTSFLCNTTTGPAWPWLKVCDATGRIISSRVAFVLIAPGPAISTEGRTQSRPNNPSGVPKDFLDAVPIPSGWSDIPSSERCGTNDTGLAIDNAALKDEFIIGEIGSNFNDRLLYVTIDELMEHVERRVAAEVRESIAAYKNLTGGYPWLAIVANPSTQISATLAVPSTLSGLIPFVTAKTGGTSNQFLTELAWEISGSGTDTLSGGATSSPSFLCYGGTYQCRLRTAAATPATIPRTITSALLRTNSIPTPIVKCTYSYATTTKNVVSISCEQSNTYTSMTSVSYTVQRRICCSGTYITISQFSGTQTRLYDITLSATQGSGNPIITSANASKTALRTITSQANLAFSGVTISDRWTPNVVGSAPFDISSGPFLQWTGSVSGTGTYKITARALPELPSWYESENWHESMYAAISPDSTPSSGTSASCSANCFSVGPRAGIDVVVIASGPQLTTISPAQNRYASTPTTVDFLEAPNATGTSTKTFSAINSKRTITYADTIATIPR
jgi:hypothetical protein